MEDYEKFVEFHLCQLKSTKDDEKEQRPKLSSLISFHGRPILPPLLSRPQRDEMGRLREAAQKASKHRKCEDDPRLSYVQTILHSVHIRKAPTLEELLKETDNNAQTSSRDTVNGSVLQNLFKKNVCHSMQTAQKVTEVLHPLTSTTCSASLSCHAQSQTCENDHHFHQASHLCSKLCSPNAYCQPSLSSGYDSYINVENTVNATSSHPVGDFVSENGTDSDEDFFNHNSSDTVKKIPDIINYPPVDGEELEMSGQESSLSNLRAENSESISSIEYRSADTSFDVFSEHKESSHLAGLQDVKIDCDLKEQSNNAPASNSLTQMHTQVSERMQSDEEDSKPSEEPYRMSLQALLKKSQEFRRRQRILRSQTKNAKIQDRAQDQPKSEEQSLSDKENDEWHSKGTRLKKSQERSDTLSPAENQSLTKSYENDRKGEEICDRSPITIESKLQDSLIMPTFDIYDSVKINNWVNISGLENVSLSVPKWEENLNKSSGHSANTSSTAFIDVRRKYHRIPAPNFCKSPVSSKVKRSAPYDKILQTEVGINKSIIKVNKAEQSTSSPLNVVETDVTSVFAKSSQHIDQLEVNLSGLKELISDLEFTLTENVDKSSSQSESHQTQLSQNNFADLLSFSLNTEYQQSLDSIKTTHENSSHMECITKAINLQEKQLVTTMTSRENGQTRLTIAQNSRRPSSTKCILSATQRMLIPDIFRNCLSEATTQTYLSASSDTSNHFVMSKFDSDEGHDSHSTSLNQSYDVKAPSELWLQRECEPQRCEKYELTPESSGEGQGTGSKVKRRLKMTEDVQEKGDKQETSVSRQCSSTYKAAAPLHEGLNSVTERQEQLKQIHAAQFRALQDEHRRQQEQLLQALAARYHVLHSVSLPYTMSTSRLWDTVTFPTLSQSSPSPLPEHYRHLLVAAAKGFLTRRLLKTERVAQLVRTVRDTQQFLKGFQQQSPNKALWSKQDLMLLERVTLQLRATRYEIYDIFFGLSAGERMQLISLDRALARERELKRQTGAGGQPKGKSSLSAATQKSLERKRGIIIQKKTAEKHRGAGTRTRHKPGSSAEQPLDSRAGQFRANPQRVPKSTYTSRPR